MELSRITILRRPPLKCCSPLGQGEQVRSFAEREWRVFKRRINTRHDRDRTDRRLESATVRGGVKASQGEGYSFVLRAAIAALRQCQHRSQCLLKGTIEVYFGVVHNATNLRAGLCVAKTNN